MFSVSFAAFKYCTFLYSYVGPGIVYFSYLECFCNVLFLFFFLLQALVALKNKFKTCGFYVFNQNMLKVLIKKFYS